MVKWWIGFNSLLILSVLIWSWQKEFISAPIALAKVLSQMALILFLLNLNMYFVFLIIRKSRVRKVKMILAKGSRKAMKLHIPIAVSASAFILIHAILMITKHPAYLTSFKFLSGFLAISMLLLLLFTGYRRHFKATGFRRRSHIVMAFVFIMSALLHIFI